MHNNKYVQINKQGIFYNVYGDDSYVIYYLTNYNITNGRIGFPLNSIDKVKDILNSNKVSYIILDDNNIIETCDFKKSNRYYKYLKQGKESYEEVIDKKNLVKSINSLPSDKIRQIIKYVNYIIYK